MTLALALLNPPPEGTCRKLVSDFRQDHETAMELILRFFLGGLLVSIFAILGDTFKPACFAGLFAAAPSIALTGLFLAWKNHGSFDFMVEAHAMIFGSLAMFVYSCACYLMVEKTRFPPWLDASILWIEWALIAFGFYSWGLA